MTPHISTKYYRYLIFTALSCATLHLTACHSGCERAQHHAQQARHSAQRADPVGKAQELYLEQYERRAQQIERDTERSTGESKERAKTGKIRSGEWRTASDPNPWKPAGSGSWSGPGATPPKRD